MPVAASQERDGRLLALVGLDLHEAGPRTIVDGEGVERPTGATDRVASIACDAMPVVEPLRHHQGVFLNNTMLNVLLLEVLGSTGTTAAM